ncbi:MAG: PKD domain-containing protein [Planctomycetota bacterium]
MRKLGLGSLSLVFILGACVLCGCPKDKDAPPDAEFTAAPVSGNAPLAVQFTDATTGKVSSWEWDFNNDGTVDSTDQSPSHTYSLPGTFTVKLIATGPGGLNEEVKTDYIVASTPPAPAAVFTVDEDFGSMPLVVQFTNASTGQITSYSWDFDNDGTADSSDVDPTYTFTQAGTYTSVLTVTGLGGSSTAEVEITVVAGLRYVDASVTSSGDGTTPETAFKTIQEALDDAVDDYMILVADGTYSGDGNTELTFGGKAVHLRSMDGAENCIIDCEGTTYAFIFGSFETDDTILDGFTITNGYTDEYYEGAGINCVNSSPMITNCIITNCTTDSWAGSAGGIFCEGGSPMITNCTITGNSSTTEWGSELGGGIVILYAEEAVIYGCTISDNTAMCGGAGIYCGEGIAVVMNCIISGNYGEDNGAGVFGDFAADVTLINCLITENEAFYSGGGVYATWDSSVGAINCTIVNNTAYQGGGIHADMDSSFMAVNTIIWGNTGESEFNDIFYSTWDTESPLALINCNYSDSAADTGSDSWFEVVLPATNCITDEPLFADEVIGDYSLSASSPCIDAGDDLYISDIPEEFNTDLAGECRTSGDSVDIGAYEYQQ